MAPFPDDMKESKQLVKNTASKALSLNTDEQANSQRQKRDAPEPKTDKDVVNASREGNDILAASTSGSSTLINLDKQNSHGFPPYWGTLLHCLQAEESDKENKSPKTFKIIKQTAPTNRAHPYKLPFKCDPVPVMTPDGILDHRNWDLPCVDQRSAALEVMGLKKVSYLGGPERENRMLCEHPDHPNKKYVLKFYGPRNSERFLREMEAIREIRHPYVLIPRSFRMVKSISFTVSHYLANGSLATHIGNLGIVTIVKYFIKIANALSFLHSRQVYHRDMRPENILIDDGNNPLISDFDMAENLRPGTSLTNKKVKTEADLQYDRYYGEKVDSFSLGVLLHCMMFETEYHELYPYYEQATNAKIPPGCQVFPMLLQTIINLVTPEWSARWNADKVLWLFAQHHQLLLPFSEASRLEEIDPIFAKGVKGAESKRALQTNNRSQTKSNAKCK